MSRTGAIPMPLAELQRTMAAAVMQPLTSDERMRSHARDGRPMQVIAESFIAPNSRLTAFERLEIYNRQYWFRVLGALAEDFPALRAVVGGRRFEAIAVAYLAEHPSRSFTLRNLGSQLADWLAAHAALAGRRQGLAVDVARVEWAFVEAFDSAKCASLSLEQVAALDGDSRLALQPHLRLMELNHAADELVVELQRKEKRRASEAGVKHEDDEAGAALVHGLRPRATWLAAHRVDLTVYYRRLAREEYLVLQALAQGRPLGEALETGFAQSRISAQRRAARVREWFSTWAELGWICAAQAAGEDKTQKKATGVSG